MCKINSRLDLPTELTSYNYCAAQMISSEISFYFKLALFDCWDQASFSNHYIISDIFHRFYHTSYLFKLEKQFHVIKILLPNVIVINLVSIDNKFNLIKSMLFVTHSWPDIGSIKHQSESHKAPVSKLPTKI